MSTNQYLEKNRAEVFHLVTGEIDAEQIQFFESISFRVDDHKVSLVLSGEEIDYFRVMPDGYLSNWPSFGRLRTLPTNLPEAENLDLLLSCTYDFSRGIFVGYGCKDIKAVNILEMLSGSREGPLEASSMAAAVAGLYRVIEERKTV